jgi:hypothetical protein
MQAAYRSGDPYLEFARQAGAVPLDATKDTHEAERDQFKACALGVQYGLEAAGLAQRIGQPVARGRHLLQAHKDAYRQFWRWSESAVDHAMLHGFLDTVFGWTIHIDCNANPRSLRNFPMQANGSEMLRLACCLGTELGVQVAAPVHDAVLVCAPDEDFDDQVAAMRECMAKASRVVLSGFELTTDVKVVRWPDRYMDEKRGRRMWDTVMSLLRSRDLVTPPLQIWCPTSARLQTLFPYSKSHSLVSLRNPMSPIFRDRDMDIEEEAVELPSVARHRSERRKRLFLRLPWDQLVSDIQVLGTDRATRLFLVLRLQEALDADRAIEGWLKLRRSLLRDVGLDRSDLSRTVAELEGAGLIEVQRRTGHRSWVRFVSTRK